jgi:holo-[acyl-carrier protein] synthase
VSAIAGIGTDLVKMDRIDRAWQRHPERFPEKILGVDELRVFRARAARDRARGVRYLATRFAAKEAFAKALGTGFRSPVRFQNIIVGHDDLGKPILEFDDELKSYLKEKNILSQHISISDEKNIATAFVVLET